MTSGSSILEVTGEHDKYSVGIMIRRQTEFIGKRQIGGMKLVLLIIVKWLKIDDDKREMITVTTSE